MIINTGQRTDIPAFYAEWFANRLKEGLVCVRNPYNPSQVSRYRLDPSVVDVIGFCTKNPAPMFPYMDLLKNYGQYWYVSLTPYGRDIEPNVPEAVEVTKEQRLTLGKEIIRIASAHGMTVRPCAEGDELAAYGADCGGCMRISDYEMAIGRHLHAPKKRGARAECACYLSCDIGAYNTCRHLCRYCYANAEPSEVLAQSRLHDPASPFLIGNYMEGDKITDVVQKSWIDEQMRLDLE